ncbi:uncharacterized protein LOC135940638 [Cloeon dipterum]|uniref:uncharacterized protein LOC135940638 n=1 Tax=Cloeon dipterum TaxID=197152 RepID=UPI00322002E2
MSRQLFALISLLLVAAAAHAGSISYEDCGSAYSLIEVDIEGCDDGFESTCDLMVGKNASVTFRFHSDSSANSLNPDVTLTTFGLSRGVDVWPRNCDALMFTTCPIGGGQTHVYTAQLFIDTDATLAQSILTWKLYNEGTLLICMRANVVVIGPIPVAAVP